MLKIFFSIIFFTGATFAKPCVVLNDLAGDVEISLREAKTLDGIPLSDAPIAQWRVGNDPERAKGVNYEYSNDERTHGYYYKYRVYKDGKVEEIVFFRRAVNKILAAKVESISLQDKRVRGQVKNISAQFGKVGRFDGVRLDIENPNPGKRPGQIHLQFLDGESLKYIYVLPMREFARFENGRIFHGDTPPLSLMSALRKSRRFLQKLNEYLGWLGYDFEPVGVGY